MLFSPVPPMSLIVTLPAVFAASPPKRPTRLSCAAFNCPPFTASFEPDAIVPSATLVILLPPLFKPALVKLTVPFVPPVMVTPLLFTVVLPVVTLPVVPKSRFGFNFTCTPSAVVSVVILLSPVTLMVSPKAKLLSVLPSPKLMPLFAVVFTCFN